MNENVNPALTEPTTDAADKRGALVIDDRMRLLKLLSKQLRNFTALFAMALAEEDADTVHDLRVCTRRLQQILSALAPEKELGKVRSVRRTLRRVRRALGTWRNCDVALHAVARKERRASKAERKSGWILVKESIAAEREDAIQSARRKLYKSGGVTLNHRIQQLLNLPPQRLGSADPAAVVRGAVAKAAGQWHEAMERAQTDRSVQNIHALRIGTKRLRYRVELARDLGNHEAAPLIGWFKLVQDRLGHWHDRQELTRFITRALANTDVLMAQPRGAVELLREVDKDLKISAREVDELFRLATQSEGARHLELWLPSYATPAAQNSSDPAADGAAPTAPEQSASDATGRSDQQPETPQTDGEANN